jgi:hypothetical protein
MHRLILVLLSCLVFAQAACGKETAPPANAGSRPCPVTVGTLRISATASRVAGISPFLVFFDATRSTDTALTGNTAVVQDVYFSWKFGDSGISGARTWAYGSNPGGNSMGLATGPLVAHAYVTSGSDTNYAATVTAYDGANTASCSISVTAFDQGGPNGFPRGATTCIASSATPVAGLGGCPAGANVLRTSSIETALSRAYGNGKRVLFKCGDTFTGDNGDNANLTAVKWAIGAYGGCQDTQHDRPIFSNSGSKYIFQFSGSNGNGTLSDFDCEGNNSPTGGCIWADGGAPVMYQDTIYNAYSNHEARSYNWAQCSQCGVVQAYMNGMGPGRMQIGSYFNFSGYAAYPYSGNAFNDINYQAVIGSHFDGGTTYYRTNSEPVRFGACPYCYVADNDFLNAGPSYAQLKFHQQNPYDAEDKWVGQYTQYDEISDNYFGGTSGAVSGDIAPQNTRYDERIRYVLLERNVWNRTGGADGRELWVAGTNITVRNNAFLMLSNGAYAIQVCQRGIEPPPRAVEIYNNTIYAPDGSWHAAAIEISSRRCGGTLNASDSYFRNNLVYSPGQRALPVVDDNGIANVTSNNTAIVTNSPSLANHSGTFRQITDWKPAANYSGGTSVPVWYDAMGAAWLPTWDLGAVHH